MFKSLDAILWSLLLHGLVVGAAFLVFEKDRTPPALEPKAPAPLEFILTDNPGDSAETRKRSRSKPTQTPDSPDLAPAKPSLKTFGLKLGSDGSSPPTSYRTGEPGPVSGYEQAEAMNVEHDAALQPFMRALWRKIDSATIYPEDFVTRRIRGTVTASIAVRADGTFGGKFHQIQSNNPMIETYVLATLTHALRDPLPESLWPKHRVHAIVVRAHFTVRGAGEHPKEQHPRQFKNILNFERSAYVEGKINDTIEDFYRKYVPPIIPIPGGFYIDFVQAYHLIRKHTEPDPEDRRNTRLELSKEAWERVIQRAR